MKIGPRYLHKHSDFPNASDERDALLRSLKGAPGLLAIRSIEPHRKGGHRAALEVDQGLLDEFIRHMDAQGWFDGF